MEIISLSFSFILILHIIPPILSFQRTLYPSEGEMVGKYQPMTIGEKIKGRNKG
jgi:hypothetical protein